MIDVITCPHCQRKLELPPQYRDCDVQCPGCKENFHVSPDRPPPPAAPPPVVTVAPQPPFAALPPDDAPTPPRRRSIARRPPPPPKPAWRGKAVAVLAIAGVACLLLVCLLPAMRGWREPRKHPMFDFAGQVKHDFDNIETAPGIEDPQTAQDLMPLLRTLGRAFRASDGLAIAAEFDADRALDRLADHGIVDHLPQGPDRNAKAVALRNDLDVGFRTWARDFAWNSAEILHVQNQQGGDLAVVIRHRVIANNTTIRLRWWLTRRDGTWRVYDMENLGLGQHFSALTGIAAAGHELAELQKYKVPLEKLGEARQAVVLFGNANNADQALKDIAATQLPPHLDAIRWAVAALVPMERGQPQGVLDAVAKARAHKADLPVLDLFEAIGCNRTAQFARAVPLLEAQNALLGGDWETNRELGDALAGLGRLDEARAAYGRSLDENPQESIAFLGLLRALGPDEPNDEVERRFRTFTDPRQQFDTMSEDCRRRHDSPALERLARAMQAFDPNVATAHFALALAKAWAEQPDAAVAAFKAGLAAEPDAGKRNGQTTLFLQAMADSGFARQAYAAAADPRETFHTLAAELKQNYRPDELRLLVAAHAPRDPGDSLLPWYQADVLVQRGQYAAADKLFTTALAKERDDRTLDRFRMSRVQASYYTGKALTAYATIGPAPQTFQQLAMLANQDRDDALLAKLIDAHAKAHADDPELYRQRLQLKIRQGDMAGATALFRETIARKQPPLERDQAINSFLYAMASAGKALAAYEAAAEVAAAFERLAGSLRNQERLADLRQLIAAHRKRHADDIWLEVYTGILHLKEQKWADAARALTDACLKAPADVRDRIRADAVYAAYKAGSARDAYNRLEPHAMVFTQLANLMLTDKKGAELLALIDAHRPKGGDDPQVMFVEARARVLQNQPDQAIKLWQVAYRCESAAWKRREFIRLFVIDMHVAKRDQEAYRAAPDQRVAFEILAQKLAQEKNAEALGKLLGERKGDRTNDPWLHYYRGEYRLLIGKANLAEQYFQSAVKAATVQQRWTFRRGLERVHVLGGHTVEAYVAAGRTTQVFRDLASICLQEKSAAQLKALIAAHRKTDPDEPTLLSWDLQALWLDGDYAGALAHLERHADAFAHLPSLRYFGDSYRVRALVKLKRAAEAIRTAEAMEKARGGNRMLLLLAYAAAGDAKGAIAVVERMPPQAYLVHDSYADADLGPLLRGEPLRAFRERFPEPPPGALPPPIDDDD